MRKTQEEITAIDMSTVEPDAPSRRYVPFPIKLLGLILACYYAGQQGCSYGETLIQDQYLVGADAQNDGCLPMMEEGVGIAMLACFYANLMASFLGPYAIEKITQAYHHIADKGEIMLESDEGQRMLPRNRGIPVQVIGMTGLELCQKMLHDRTKAAFMNWATYLLKNTPTLYLPLAFDMISTATMMLALPMFHPALNQMIEWKVQNYDEAQSYQEMLANWGRVLIPMMQVSGLFRLHDLHQRQTVALVTSQTRADQRSLLRKLWDFDPCHYRFFEFGRQAHLARQLEAGSNTFAFSQIRMPANLQEDLLGSNDEETVRAPTSL